HAYSELYLEEMQEDMGLVFDLAVNVLHYDINEFNEIFINSTIAKKIEYGDSSVLAGKSGIEMLYDVLDERGDKYRDIQQEDIDIWSRSPQYWAGWILCYYQWYTAISFLEIYKTVTAKDIEDMYMPYHEMDESQFVDEINRRRSDIRAMTYLKYFRQKAGYTQQQLADLTEVPVKTIRQYEQGQKNINKASAETVIKFSRVLCCQPFDLLEK
ncbi:MAG: helix-turn-helix domain-containing protein, partial [Lachnospiraceae bacterium]|nr:helix-turn-helix domain-containing protein [Lachnospiraceae bacterium]